MLESHQSGALTLAAAFFLGMTGVLSCGCNYALFAVVAGYSGTMNSQDKNRNAIPAGLSFLIGAILSMAIMGALVGYAGKIMGNTSGLWWKIITSLIYIFFGLWSLDVLPFNFPALNMNKMKIRTGIIPSVLFGLTIGSISVAFNSCCNPVFPVILAGSFISGSGLWGMLMLTFFAMGYSLPLAIGFLGLSWGFGKAEALSGKLSKIIPKVGGGILILMGFYFLLTI